MGNYDAAYESAMIEYNRRPLNIDVNETVAWAAFRAGKIKESEVHINNALATNSKNPKLLYKVAIILNKKGSPKGIEYMDMAKQVNPGIKKYFISIS